MHVREVANTNVQPQPNSKKIDQLVPWDCTVGNKWLDRIPGAAHACHISLQFWCSNVFPCLISKYIFFSFFSLAISCRGVALLQPCGNLSSEAMHSASVRYEMMLYSFEN